MTDLVAYHSSEGNVSLKENFLVPKDWKSCGLAIHVSGSPNLTHHQPVALALTPSDLCLCTPKGPITSIPLTNIRDVRVEDLTGISFPKDTPSGPVDIIPPMAKGFTISYVVTKMGLENKVTVFTLTPDTAHEWVHELLNARVRKAETSNSEGKLTRR